MKTIYTSSCCSQARWQARSGDNKQKSFILGQQTEKLNLVNYGDSKHRSSIKGQQAEKLNMKTANRKAQSTIYAQSHLLEKSELICILSSFERKPIKLHYISVSSDNFQLNYLLLRK